MKRQILIFIFFPLTIFSQQNLRDTTDKREIFVVFDEMPYYPGGFLKMKEFIDKNIVRPPNYPKGNVYVKFIIDKTGQITKPTIVKGLNAACDKAALDVVQKMPKFSIPKNAGKPVDCPFNLPIEFK
jgi:periplasmic protein TonB